jgi:hypothetical protein
MKKIALLTCAGLMASPAFGGGVMGKLVEKKAEVAAVTGAVAVGGLTVYAVKQVLKNRRVKPAATELGAPVVEQTEAGVIEEKQEMELAAAASSDGVATDGSDS